jgi:hypothetical protein
MELPQLPLLRIETDMMCIQHEQCVFVDKTSHCRSEPLKELRLLDIGQLYLRELLSAQLEWRLR